MSLCFKVLSIAAALAFVMAVWANLAERRATTCYEQTSRAECWGLASSFWEQK